MVINVPFHLFQEVINQFTVVIALESTEFQMIDRGSMIDHHETTEVQDIPETTEVQEIPEIMTVKIQL